MKAEPWMNEPPTITFKAVGKREDGTVAQTFETRGWVTQSRTIHAKLMDQIMDWCSYNGHYLTWTITTIKE